MPLNGTAVALPIPPEISSAPAVSTEDRIGRALLAFTVLSMQTVREVQGGKISAATRSQGGDLIAQLYWLRAELGETKFVAAMHQQARLRLCHGANLSAEMAAGIADDMLGTVNKVVATVQAMN